MLLLLLLLACRLPAEHLHLSHLCRSMTLHPGHVAHLHIPHSSDVHVVASHAHTAHRLHIVHAYAKAVQTLIKLLLLLVLLKLALLQLLLHVHHRSLHGPGSFFRGHVVQLRHLVRRNPQALHRRVSARHVHVQHVRIDVVEIMHAHAAGAVGVHSSGNI